jgi:Na+/melibiose symporter-like transporter
VTDVGLQAPKVDTGTKLFYGFGSIAVGIKDSGFKSLLLIYYNQVIGLPAGKVAAAIMIALVLDSILDPIIGQVSDNWRSRWGRRHPFMYAAALPSALSFLLLWFPPTDWSETALLGYLIVSAVILRSFITVYEIPSAALVSELTTDYDQRTSLMSFRYYFFFTGGLLLTLLTFRVFLQPDAEFPVGQLNPHGYQKYGLVAATLMFLSIVISTAGTHRHIPNLRKPIERPRPPLLQTLREMYETIAHRSFLMLTVAGVCKSMSIGISGALGIYISTYFWSLDSSEIAILTLDSLFSAVLAATLTRPISQRFGKRNTCMVFYIGAFLVGTAPLVLRHFGLYFENDSSLLVPALFVNGLVFSAFGMSSTILASSMIADVVEDSERRTGRRSEGLFFSAGSLISKAISGTGVFGAGLILQFVDFPQKAKPDQIDPAILDKLAMTYVPVAAAIYAVGLFCMSRYKISRTSHENNLAALSAEAPANTP